MKLLIAISAIQSVLLCVVLIKLFDLSGQKSVGDHYRQEVAFNDQHANTAAQQPYFPQALSENQVRTIIRQELAAHLSQSILNQRSIEREASNSNQQIDEDTQKMVSDEQRAQLEEYLDRVDYLFADGEFSKSDNHEFEQSLASLPAPLRQELLNKLAKSMTKSQTGFSN